MAYFMTIFLILVTVWQSSVSTKLERSSIKKMRKRRSADSAPEVSSIPDMSTILQSQSNMQSAYFLGQCLMCPPGPQGPTGQQGLRGIPGRDGRDAILVGSFTGEVSRDREIAVNATQEYVPLGAEYTRWGTNSCGNGGQLLYEGVMAGAHYTHAGGASNYICLSREPIFQDPVAGFQHNAFIYGTEYETGASQTLPHLQNAEAPCAVCLAPSRTITIMIPGRNACPTAGDRDWNLEYKGFLMSQHHTQSRTEYICVDSEAEGIVSTYGDHNGALLYMAEAACVTGGGIPCPPYTEGFEVTCAVCSL